MKKSLLATTALAALGVATVAAPASAEGFEVKVGGFMEQWFGYTDTSNTVSRNSDSWVQHSDTEMHVSAKNTLDNGLTIGLMMEFEAESSGGGNVDEQYMTIEGSFGKIIMGSENTAPYLMHYAAKSNGIGIEEGDGPGFWAYGATGALVTTNRHVGIHSDDNSITFISPRMNGIQVGASFVPERANDDDTGPTSGAREANGQRDNGFGLAANYETSVSDMSVKVSVGYTDAGDDKSALMTGDDVAFTGAVQLGFGGFTTSFAYGEQNKDDTTTATSAYKYDVMQAGLAYNAGPMGVSLIVASGENSVDNTKLGFLELGANYAIGPGVTAKGSIYSWKQTDDGVREAEGTAVAAGLVLSF
jgi:outer membrane protein OmpU